MCKDENKIWNYFSNLNYRWQYIVETLFRIFKNHDSFPPTASPKRPPWLGLCAGCCPWVPGPAERLQRWGAQAVAYGHTGDSGGAEGPREPHQRHLYQQQPPVHCLWVSLTTTRHTPTHTFRGCQLDLAYIFKILVLMSCFTCHCHVIIFQFWNKFRRITRVWKIT